MKQPLTHSYGGKLQTTSDCYTEGCPKLLLLLPHYCGSQRGPQSVVYFRGTLDRIIAHRGT